MKYLIYCKKIVYFFFFNGVILFPLVAQITPPDPSADREWVNWWQDNTKNDVETEFNAARRNEETQLGLPPNTLGNLNLPTDFLTRNFQEQALIIINAERQARHNIFYPGTGTVSGMLVEGVEIGLSGVAQGHANDMQINNFFSHTGSNGWSPSQRITNAFPQCTEGTSENIAWNSFSSPGGFILGIPLALYSFIYDDSFHGWGHRHLCLKQSGLNNYGDPNKLGLVGFGRATGANGDYFVMDYFDPKSTCTYNVTNFEGGGNCPTHMDVSGMIASGTYQATETVASTGSIPNSETVYFKAGTSITLESSFETSMGAELEVLIETCNYTARLYTGEESVAIPLNRHYNFKKGVPVYTSQQ